MHRYRAWGLAAALAAGTAAPAAAANPSAPPTTLFAKWFGSSDGKKAAPPTRGPRNAVPAVPPAPPSPEVTAAALKAEQEAWDRRMSVCLKLREVALERNDEALTRQAEELERQATALYNIRVAALGVPKVKAPLPLSDTPSPDSLNVAARKLTAPATPSPVDPAVRTAEARTPTDTVREVQP